MLLALDVGHVHRVGCLHGGRQWAGLVARQGHRPIEVVDQGGQAGHRVHLQPLHQRCLGGVLPGHVDPPQVPLPGQRDHGQDAVGVADGAVEGELSHYQGAIQVVAELTGGDKDAEGHGEIVGRPLLA